MDCGTPSSPTMSTYSLIGAGWRLVPGRTSDGRETMSWRCRECSSRLSASKLPSKPV